MLNVAETNVCALRTRVGERVTPLLMLVVLSGQLVVLDIFSAILTRQPLLTLFLSFMTFMFREEPGENCSDTGLVRKCYCLFLTYLFISQKLHII